MQMVSVPDVKHRHEGVTALCTVEEFGFPVCLRYVAMLCCYVMLLRYVCYVTYVMLCLSQSVHNHFTGCYVITVASSSVHTVLSFIHGVFLL